MRIAVCIKLVPDPRLAIKLNPIARRVKGLREMPLLVNPADLAALELAVRVKEQTGGEVTVLTVGTFVPANVPGYTDIVLEARGLRNEVDRLNSPDPLRRCLATGADRVVAICLNNLRRNQEVSSGSGSTGPAGMLPGGFRPLNIDYMMAATVLAQYIRQSGADLVFCGDRSYDQGNGLVGTAVAELLDMPLVLNGLSATPEAGDRSLVVRRRLERGECELVRCTLPCVLTVAAGSAVPRYFALTALIDAFETGIEALDLTDLGLSMGEIGVRRTTRLLWLDPPRPRTKKIFIPDSSLPPEVRASLAMSGGMSQGDKGTRLVEGNPEQAAAEVIQFLQSEGILPSE